MQLKNNDFVEKLIIKAMLENKRYNALISSAIDPSYFESSESAIVFNEIKKYFKEYKDIPNKSILENMISEEKKDDVVNYLTDIESIDIDVSNKYDFIVNETDQWIKENALKNAILSSADILNKGNPDEYNNINALIRNALTKTLKFELGTNYFEDMGSRLKRMFNTTENRISTGYPSLDEIMAGGIPSKSLTMLFGRTHGNKSGTMINMIARQVLQGRNVVLFTLEMSEDMSSQRFDAIFSGYDINRIYLDRRKELVKELNKIKQIENKGTLIIKEWPTGAASTANFKSHLYEMEMRDIKVDLCYADYLGLMTPEVKMSKDGLYESGKQISVELRGLAFEFDMPVISVSQMNRTGSKISLYETDFTDVAESYGISATADFISILGIDESLLTYQNELHYKIVKNRYGGRVGTLGKFYLDPYTLKLYDDMELDLWMDDAMKNSNNPREVFEKR